VLAYAGFRLAWVNPVFTWVRLAQRVPVRIHIDQVPDRVRLVAGMTPTVDIVGRCSSRGCFRGLEGSALAATNYRSSPVF
jgi:multidrug resistance efflux pump